MKEWSKAEIIELDLRCTQSSSEWTSHVDEERVDPEGNLWRSTS